jgi:hypothetical protein
MFSVSPFFIITIPLSPPQSIPKKRTRFVSRPKILPIFGSFKNKYDWEKNIICFRKEKISMKKKIYTRPVSVVLTEEIFNSIKEITDQGNIGVLWECEWSCSG